MIWHDRRIKPALRVTVPSGDQTCNHGLGLFETFRTWDGRAPLLGHHLARLGRSAATLGILVEPASLPTDADITLLADAYGRPDLLVRLTLTGGEPGRRAGIAWMTAGALPPPAPRAGYVVRDAGWTVALADPLCRHKTLNYWGKRLAYEQAQADGFDEAIFASADGRLWEGSRTNLFAVVGRRLVTPPATGPLVPGILRELVLDLAARADLHPVEADVGPDLVAAADEVFLTNSVRGLIPVRAWLGRRGPSAEPAFPAVGRLSPVLHDYLTTAKARP